MDIKSTLAAGTYAKAREAAEPNGKGGSLADAIAGYARDFNQTLQTAEKTAQDAMTGKADPHSLVEALSQAQLAIETAVTVRDKVVEAYQEIIRMPV